jgi:hypothetical protein
MNKVLSMVVRELIDAIILVAVMALVLYGASIFVTWWAAK